MPQDAAGEVASELLLHVIGYAVAHGIGTVGQGEVGLQVFPDDAVQGGGLGPAPTIGPGMGAGGWPGGGGRHRLDKRFDYLRTLEDPE